jgi:hypothetical protein
VGFNEENFEGKTEDLNSAEKPNEGRGWGERRGGRGEGKGEEKKGPGAKSKGHKAPATAEPGQVSCYTRQLGHESQSFRPLIETPGGLVVFWRAAISRVSRLLSINLGIPWLGRIQSTYSHEFRLEVHNELSDWPPQWWSLETLFTNSGQQHGKTKPVFRRTQIRGILNERTHKQHIIQTRITDR